MTSEKNDKDYKEEENKTEEDSKEDEKEKTKSLDESIKALAETVSKIDTSGIKDSISEVSKKIDSIDSRVKALEEPTDMPAKPKVQAEDDIGDKTKVPDTYQSNSQQASIRDSDDKNEIESDEGKLSMQEKTKSQKEETLSSVEKRFTTETPRPGAAPETNDRTSGPEPNPVLKAMREVGLENADQVARRINKGEFGGVGQSEEQW